MAGGAGGWGVAQWGRGAGAGRDYLQAGMQLRPGWLLLSWAGEAAQKLGVGSPPACPAATWLRDAEFASSSWEQGSSTCVRSSWPRWTRRCTPRQRPTPWKCLPGCVKRCWVSPPPQVPRGLGDPAVAVSLRPGLQAWLSRFFSRLGLWAGSVGTVSAGSRKSRAETIQK